jgi:thiol-disulfide isomerase/thioredoxin
LGEVIALGEISMLRFWPWLPLILVVAILLVGLIALHPYPDAAGNIDPNGRSDSREAAEGAYTMSTNPLVAHDYGTAPELNNTIWINSDTALRLADLRNKVVLLEFWTFDCINCQRTLPAMNHFYSKYTDKGLVIIGDHFPEFSYERDVVNVRHAVKEYGIQYAVAIDNDGATWNSYHQHYWPTMYLIDKRGHIRYVAIGEHDYNRTEEAIKSLLAE